MSFYIDYQQNVLLYYYTIFTTLSGLSAFRWNGYFELVGYWVEHENTKNRPIKTFNDLNLSWTVL